MNPQPPPLAAPLRPYIALASVCHFRVELDTTVTYHEIAVHIRGGKLDPGTAVFTARPSCMIHGRKHSISNSWSSVSLSLTNKARNLSTLSYTHSMH